MRRSPSRGTAIRGAPAAPARRACHRALPQMRRSAPRVRARVLPRMPSRLPARVFVQGAVFLPELSSEARARLWGLGRGKRFCARTSPAIRLHRAANAAADLLAQARTAGGAVLAADGVFRADGAFVVLPVIPVKLLEWGFRSEVLKLLVAEGAIGERLSASPLAWRHSGLSVHNGVRVPAGDHLAS